MSGTNHAHLARVVRERREALPGLPTQLEMAQRAGVSGTTWGLIENEKPVGIRSLIKVMRSLGYTDASAQTVLDGGDPVPSDPPRVEERFVLPADTGPGDSIDLNSRVARLPDEDQEYITNLIDRFEREMRDKGR